MANPHKHSLPKPSTPIGYSFPQTIHRNSSITACMMVQEYQNMQRVRCLLAEYDNSVPKWSSDWDVLLKNHEIHYQLKKSP